MHLRVRVREGREKRSRMQSFGWNTVPFPTALKNSCIQELQANTRLSSRPESAMADGVGIPCCIFTVQVEPVPSMTWSAARITSEAPALAFHARVHPAIDHIGQQVHQYIREPDRQQASLHQRVIAIRD